MTRFERSLKSEHKARLKSAGERFSEFQDAVSEYTTAVILLHKRKSDEHLEEMRDVYEHSRLKLSQLFNKVLTELQQASKGKGSH